MKNIALYITALCLGSIPLVSDAQNIWDEYNNLFTPPRTYVTYQTDNPITIDGKADETVWKQAAWSDDFIDIEGAQKPRPTYQTRMKILWDKDNLYVYAELEEPHIWSYYSVRDQIVFHENDFEIFIDPGMNTHNYFEFELNAANTLFDLFLPKPYRNGGIPMLTWNAPGFKSAVSVHGTLNDPTDRDEKWTVEVAIPFESLKLGLNHPVPNNGQIWKINFSRVEWKSFIENGKYQKQKDEKTGRFLSEDNWVWNPTGEINMHVPERWGMVQFSNKTINEEKVAFKMPEHEGLKKYLWIVYYKQHAYRATHGSFASSLAELSIPSDIPAGSGQSARLKLQATNLQFTVQLTGNNGLRMSVNESGLFNDESKKTKK